MESCSVCPGKDAEKSSAFSFSGVRAWFVPMRIPKKRLDIIKACFGKNGGVVVDIDVYLRSPSPPSFLLHVVVCETLEIPAIRRQLELKRLLNPETQELTSPCISVVRVDWITLSAEKRILLDRTPYLVVLKAKKRKSEMAMETSPAKSERPLVKMEVSPGKKSGALNLEKFACSQSSLTATVNVNERVTAELERMLGVYRVQKDTWRVMSYERVINLIKSLPYELTTWEEARNLRGVGDSLADKIFEIIESGKLRKAEELSNSERVQVVSLFSGIWGVGTSVAEQWYNRGWRTLDDARASVNLLTRQQTIGLQHYDDFKSRIPREEAAEIESTVRAAASSVSEEPFVVEACGSYRRGKPTCGDVDVLITHAGLESHEPIFDPLLDTLRRSGFLTSDLVVQDTSGSQRKYLGVCRLPGENRKFRRIDIIVVPWKEYAPALLYFTGSAHFNRSMRLLAMKKGMSLSEHGLRAGVQRVGQQKVSDGHLLETPTEESIFQHLGLEFRPPVERDH